MEIPYTTRATCRRVPPATAPQRCRACPRTDFDTAISGDLPSGKGFAESCKDARHWCNVKRYWPKSKSQNLQQRTPTSRPLADATRGPPAELPTTWPSLCRSGTWGRPLSGTNCSCGQVATTRKSSTSIKASRWIWQVFFIEHVLVDFALSLSLSRPLSC